MQPILVNNTGGIQFAARSRVPAAAPVNSTSTPSLCSVIFALLASHSQLNGNSTSTPSK